MGVCMALRRLSWFLLLCCCASPQPTPAVAPTVATPAGPPTPGVPAGPTVHGIQVGDLDHTQNPCTDFYAYANGSWRAANPIPASMVRWSRRWMAGEQNKEQLKVVLEEVAARGDWPNKSVEQLTGDFYAACMDQAAVDRAGLAPIEHLLVDLARMHTRADLQRIIAQLHGLDIAVPFAVASAQDLHEPTRVLAEISAGTRGMPDRDYYLLAEPRFVEARKKYEEHVARMFVLAGFSRPRAAAAATTVLRMETEQARAALARAELREPKNQDHPMSLAALQRLARSFSWGPYFAQAKIPTAWINVTEPALLSAVDRQLRQASVSDWSIFLRWHLLRSAAPSLSRDLVEESFDFEERYLAGAQELKPRWKRCAEAEDKLLGEALGKKYVERYFSPEAKARMRVLVDNLLLGMKESIGTLSWMGPETKQRALAKLATFKPKIGYPDRWKDYSTVVITRTSHWKNVVAAQAFNVRDDWGLIGKPLNRDRWSMTTPTSNASYNPSLNDITFPAGILQPPAFDLAAADAVNYGAIGVVIGHEISHGFDDEGAQFDADGRFANWWTPADLKEFQRRGACVADQFEGYFIEPGIHHNGKLVLGEAIGDLAGGRIAWLGFQKSREGKPPQPTLDGFNPEQQFWISWGQFRGDAIRPETQRKMVQSDPHPIAKFRVIGPLSNLPEFRDTFHCAEGTAMVRPDAVRCEVW